MLQLLMTALGAAALPAGAGCAELPGSRALVAESVDYVLVGEYHGTNEMPAMARDLACAAAATGRPLVVGIELAPANQAALDAYLRSDGSAPARAALVASPGWAEEGGRTTAAIVDLVEAARRIGRRHPTTIVAFDAAPTERGTSAAREKAMADTLAAAQRRVPGSLVVALTGAGHAGKSAWTSYDPPFPGAGQLLPPDRTIALTFARPGGHYWGCHAPDGDRTRGCTAYEMPAREPIVPRGITLDRTLRDGFDGVYSPGRRYTASAPGRTPAAVASDAASGSSVAARGVPHSSASAPPAAAGSAGAARRM